MKIFWALGALALLTFAGIKLMNNLKWVIQGNEVVISFMTLLILIGVVYLGSSIIDVIRKKA
jgi:hypothetical protein